MLLDADYYPLRRIPLSILRLLTSLHDLFDELEKWGDGCLCSVRRRRHPSVSEGRLAMNIREVITKMLEGHTLLAVLL